MADEEVKSNTGSEAAQAAWEAEKAALQEKLQKAEANVQAKQEFVNRQSNEIGALRSQEQELKALKETVESLTSKLESVLEKKPVEGEPKVEQSPRTPDGDGTTPNPQEDAKVALRELYGKLNDEQRQKVDEYAKSLPDEAKALLSDNEARVELLTRAIGDLGFDVASPKKESSIWDGIAPEPKKLSSAERLRQILDGNKSQSRPSPSVPRSAFAATSARPVQSGGNPLQVSDETPGAAPPAMGTLFDGIAKIKGDKGG